MIGQCNGMEMERLQVDLEYVTASRALPEGEALSEALRRLDARAAEPELPERLAHYLSKRSYAKALAWLENPDMPHHP